ncbi:MAG: PorT family protein [Bacteroidales bacterium]|nr:PorT family protein [Bacteroidales bacterium]
MFGQNSKKDKISFFYNGGLNFSQKIITNYYSVYNSDKTPETNYSLGMKHGLGAEYNISDKLNLVLGINYSRINLGETNKILDYQTELIENQDWISIPISCKMYFLKSKLKPYIKAGFDFAYLLDISGEVTKKYVDDPSYSQETSIVSFDKKRQKSNLVLSGGIGVSYDLTNISLFIESNYERGLLNNVNGENRFSDTELISQYSYIDSDYKIQSYVILLGIIFRK